MAEKGISVSTHTRECACCRKEFSFEVRGSTHPNFWPKYCQDPECQKEAEKKRKGHRRKEVDMSPRTCALCGKTYVPKDRSHADRRYKFCSKECLCKSRRLRKRKTETKERTCCICHKPYVSSAYWKKTCSPECAKALRKMSQSRSHARKYVPHAEEKVVRKAACAVCGREFEFETTKSVSEKFWRKYCSDECRLEADRRKGHRALAPRKAKCEICGKEFETTNGSKLTCSPECSAKLRRARKMESWRRHYVRKPKTTVEATCPVCGKAFSYEVRESGVPEKFRRKYCSEECSAKALVERRRAYDRIYSARRRKPRVMKEFETVCSRDAAPRAPRHTPASVFDRSPRKCVVCGEEYVPRARDQKTCCKECAAESAKRRKRELYVASHPRAFRQPEPRACAVCGREFVPDKHHPFAKCCSVKCRKQLENRKHVYVRRSPPPPRACKWCGTVFTPSVHHPHKACCSASCGKKFKRYGVSEVQRAFEAASMPGRKAIIFDFDRSPRKCLVCGNEFVPKTSKHAVCSKHCRDVLSGRQAVAKHPTYERTCRVCGKPFVTKNPKRTTCSHECAYRNRSLWSMLKDGGKPAEKRPKKGVCKVCGKEFEYVQKGTPRKYCSDACCRKYWNRIYHPKADESLSPEELAAKKAAAAEKRREYFRAYWAEYQKRPEVIAKKLKRAEEDREFRARLRAIREGDLAAIEDMNERAKAEAALRKAEEKEAKKEARRKAREAEAAFRKGVALAKRDAARAAKASEKAARRREAEEARYAKILAAREKRRLVAMEARAAKEKAMAENAAAFAEREAERRERRNLKWAETAARKRALARERQRLQRETKIADARERGLEVAKAVCEECGAEFEYVVCEFTNRAAPRFCTVSCKSHWDWEHGGRERSADYFRRCKEKGGHWRGRRFVTSAPQPAGVSVEWRGQPGSFYGSGFSRDPLEDRLVESWRRGQAAAAAEAGEDMFGGMD